MIFGTVLDLLESLRRMKMMLVFFVDINFSWLSLIFPVNSVPKLYNLLSVVFDI